MDINQLVELIATTWKCDSSRYPELAGMNASERKNFVIKHSVLHITKTNGKIAAVCEDFDHNRVLSADAEKELEALAVKMFINALKLAEEAGVTFETLVQKAPEYIK